MRILFRDDGLIIKSALTAPEQDESRLNNILGKKIVSKLKELAEYGKICEIIIFEEYEDVEKKIKELIVITEDKKVYYYDDLRNLIIYADAGERIRQLGIFLGIIRTILNVEILEKKVKSIYRKVRDTKFRTKKAVSNKILKAVSQLNALKVNIRAVQVWTIDVMGEKWLPFKEQEILLDITDRLLIKDGERLVVEQRSLAKKSGKSNQKPR